MYEKVARGDLNSCKNSRAKRSARIDAIKPIDDEDYDLLEGSDYDQLEGSGVSKDQDLDYGMEDYEEEEVDGMWDDENMVICDNIERKHLFSMETLKTVFLYRLLSKSLDCLSKETGMNEFTHSIPTASLAFHEINERETTYYSEALSGF